MQIKKADNNGLWLTPVFATMEKLGFSFEEDVTPLDYFQVVYYQKELDTIWRLNLKPEIEKFEYLHDFDLIKALQQSGMPTFLMVNHYKRKSRHCSTIDECTKVLLPFTILSWIAEQRDDEGLKGEEDILHTLTNSSIKYMDARHKKICPVIRDFVIRAYNYRDNGEGIVRNFQVRLTHLLMTACLFYYSAIKSELLDGNMVSEETMRSTVDLMHSGSSFRVYGQLQLEELRGAFDLYEDSNLPWLYQLYCRTKKIPPLYFLDRNLYYLFMNSDIPDDLSFLSEYYPESSFILSFPHEYNSKINLETQEIYYSKRDGKGSWAEQSIIYCHYSPDDSTLIVENYLALTATDSLPTVLSYQINLKNVSQSILEEADLIDEDENVKLIWSRRIAICLHVLLYGITQPDFSVAPLELSPHKTRKKGNKFKRSNNHWNMLEPRILGHETPSIFYASPPGSANSSGLPSRSVSPHFRRGHWKRVPVGKGRCDRAIKWIRPTYVNLSKGGEDVKVEQ